MWRGKVLKIAGAKGIATAIVHEPTGSHNQTVNPAYLKEKENSVLDNASEMLH